MKARHLVALSLVLGLLGGWAMWGEDPTPEPTPAQPAAQISTTPSLPPRLEAPTPTPQPQELDELNQGELLFGRSEEDAGGLDEGQGQPIEAHTPVSIDPSTSYGQFLDQAITAAEQAAEAFARPEPVDAQQWWEGLSLHLAPRAADLYQGTDPVTVPYAQVLSQGALMPSPAPPELLTIVRIYVDTGAVLVELESTPQGWKATYFDLSEIQE